jgi:hypothetical protein
MKKTYSEIARTKIAKRIESIKDYDKLKEIFKMAHDHNEPYIKKGTRGQQSGVYLQIDLWSNDTLKILEEFLDEHYPEINKVPLMEHFKIPPPESQSQSLSQSQTQNSESDDFILRKNLKLRNLT